MKKILVIGQDGMLGSELYERLEKKTNYQTYKTTLETLDISDEIAVLQKIKAINPDYVINCAAFTNVDGCETNYVTAKVVNGISVLNISKAVKSIGSVLIQISTDYVFDGKLDVNLAYTEDMQVGPVSAYGSTKLLGEKNAKVAEKYYILRTAWLYGKNGKNFVKTMLKLSEIKEEISVVADQNGSPTSTTTLCEIIEKILEINPEYGIYHSTNEGFTNWYQFTKDIMEISGKSTKIIPISSEEYKKMYPKSTNRPKNSKLSKEKLHKVGIYPKEYKEALKDYLQNQYV